MHAEEMSVFIVIGLVYRFLGYEKRAVIAALRSAHWPELGPAHHSCLGSAAGRFLGLR